MPKVIPPLFLPSLQNEGAKKTRAHLVFLSGRHRKKRKPWNKRENIVFPLPPPAHEFIFTTMGGWGVALWLPSLLSPFHSCKGTLTTRQKKGQGRGICGRTYPTTNLGRIAFHKWGREEREREILGRILLSRTREGMPRQEEGSAQRLFVPIFTEREERDPQIHKPAL